MNITPETCFVDLHYGKSPLAYLQNKLMRSKLIVSRSGLRRSLSNLWQVRKSLVFVSNYTEEFETLCLISRFQQLVCKNQLRSLQRNHYQNNFSPCFRSPYQNIVSNVYYNQWFFRRNQLFYLRRSFNNELSNKHLPVYFLTRIKYGTRRSTDIYKYTIVNSRYRYF